MDDINDIILKRAQNGDASAFEEILTAYEKRIYQLCLRVSGSREDALDLTQEVFLRIYRNLSGFKGQSKLSTWVYRVTMNVCMDEMRKRKGKVYVSTEEMNEAGSLPEACVPSPEEETLSAELRAQITAAIDALPPEQRLAVVMRDVQDMKYEDIAAALNINMNTLKSRIARGRQALKRILSTDSNFLSGSASNL